MRYLFLTALISFSFNNPKPNIDAMIYDFNSSSKRNDWKVVNDDVMGGISNSTIEINSEGHGLFTGEVSTENNGGFASVRHQFDTKIGKKTKISMRLKGDSKSYQLRIKSKLSDYYSYVHDFQTTDKWETIEINLQDMYPSFRGRKLDMNNFNSPSIQEISILIGNKVDESFKLLIDKIELI
jgi:hypothetical protein